MGILNIEFKQKVEGLDEVTCNSISSDPMNGKYFILSFGVNDIWIVPIINIKHISASCK